MTPARVKKKTILLSQFVQPVNEWAAVTMQMMIYPCPPHGRSLEIAMGEGGSLKVNILK